MIRVALIVLMVLVACDSGGATPPPPPVSDPVPNPDCVSGSAVDHAREVGCGCCLAPGCLDLVMPLGWGTTVHENVVALATRSSKSIWCLEPALELELGSLTAPRIVASRVSWRAREHA